MFNDLFKLIFDSLIFFLIFSTQNIFGFNFLFSSLITSFTLAKVGTKYSFLHVLINFMSAVTLFATFYAVLKHLGNLVHASFELV